MITKSETKIYYGEVIDEDNYIGMITENSAATAITVSDATLGSESMYAGTKYTATSKCYTSGGLTSEWSQPFVFSTLVDYELTFAELSGGVNIICSATASYYEVTVATCGFYYSTNSDGSNAVLVTCTDESDWSAHTISNLSESTTYYIIAWMTDSEGRSYQMAWTDAEVVTTTRIPPVIVISVSTPIGARTITGSVNVTSAATVTRQRVYIKPSSAAWSAFQFIELNPNTGTQTFTFANGDKDYYGNEITINELTSYDIYSDATNVGDTTESSIVTVTTPEGIVNGVALSMSNVSYSSSTGNLTYTYN